MMPLPPPQQGVASPAIDQRVCVLGLGYVGLPTALLFARHGYSVCGVDINPNVLALFANNTVGKHFPELAEWWQALTATPSTTFKAQATPSPSDVFIITVPTPVDPITHACDLTAVRAATQAIVPVLQAGNMVILESTVPPGTTQTVVQPILESTGLVVGQSLDLCFSPERILPGNSIAELTQNPRVVGGVTPESGARAKALFSTVISGAIQTTTARTAEFCKLAENTYRDVNIALANELAMIADANEVSIEEAIPIINQHPRVTVLKPGIGVGGHCIAVDPWFFVELEPTTTRLIGTARQVNDAMPAYRVAQIVADIRQQHRPLAETIVCVAGLTYKPNVADCRESPALTMVKLLRDAGLTVRCYDPLLPDYKAQTLEQTLAGADYLALLVSHDCLVQALGDSDSTQRRSLLQVMRTPVIRVFG
jgi:UDP-N-acetyl-D-mannosaminuronic acid dehydrogenase